MWTHLCSNHICFACHPKVGVQGFLIQGLGLHPRELPTQNPEY